MRGFLILGSIVILFFGIIELKNGLSAFRSQDKGRMVTVVLGTVPRGKGEAEIVYNGLTYYKKVGRTFHQDHKKGDTLVLRHEKGTDQFYFDTETGTFALVIAIIGIVLGLTCFYKGVKMH